MQSDLIQCQAIRNLKGCGSGNERDASNHMTDGCNSTLLSQRGTVHNSCPDFPSMQCIPKWQFRGFAVILLPQDGLLSRQDLLTALSHFEMYLLLELIWIHHPNWTLKLRIVHWRMHWEGWLPRKPGLCNQVVSTWKNRHYPMPYEDTLSHVSPH